MIATAVPVATAPRYPHVMSPRRLLALVLAFVLFCAKAAPALAAFGAPGLDPGAGAPPCHGVMAPMAHDHGETPAEKPADPRLAFDCCRACVGFSHDLAVASPVVFAPAAHPPARAAAHPLDVEFELLRPPRPRS